MIDYTSLRIVRVLEFAWLYYPNGLLTPFGISKGYFTWDSTNNKLLIIEDGRSQRPKVNLANVTIEDVYLSEAEISFTNNFASFSNILTSKGCPLAVDQIQVAIGGIPEAPVDGNEYVRKDAGWVINTGGVSTETVRQIETYVTDMIELDDAGIVTDVVNQNNLSEVILWTVLDDENIQILNGCLVDDVIKIIYNKI